MRTLLTGLLSFGILFSCTHQGNEKAQQVIDQGIAAHGGKKLVGSTLSFDFRDIHYTAKRTPNSYTYTRSFIRDEDTIRDILINSHEFVRTINGDTVHLHDTTATKYANSVNSVLYFIQLPFQLNDPAVNKTYQGTTSIEGAGYDVIKVTFDVQNGGQDHQDEYMYWFNQKTQKLDYLAYNYETDGGGVRFRSAYNRVERGGITFQDYINYEAPIGTPLSKLPGLMENGKLKKLSRIENENIQVRNRN